MPTTPNIPVFESKDRNAFILKYKHLFSKFTDIEAENMLTAIWTFGNTRWLTGYNQGFYDPDFENTNF